MYAVVVKPFTANGVPYEAGDTVDISNFPKGDVLIRTRLLRPATVDEVMEATGKEMPAASKSHPSKDQSPAARTPSKGTKPKVVATAAPEPPPLRQSRQARAKAAAAHR